MLKKVKLKFSSTPEKDALEFDVAPITVFVGPNNSGKSKALAEIESYCRTGNLDQTRVIIKDIEFEKIPAEKLTEEIAKYTIDPIGVGRSLREGNILFGKQNGASEISLSHLRASMENPEQELQTYCQYYIAHFIMRLDGNNRIVLTNPQSGYNLKNPSGNLATLFADDSKRENVRKIIQNAFSKYFVIDPTNPPQLSIRLSSEAPMNASEERRLDGPAVEFYRKAIDISLMSDGVKSFTGIIISIIAGDPKIILIDEPEAFLHPSLANKLGKEISTSLSESDKKLFVSTHSSSFLMGCIQSGTPINIVRLTYMDNVATARLLPENKIIKLMRNPLLRSTGVLNGLFHESVIITEADSDRAFYQEINERNLSYDADNGISNTLFLNAQNKDTIHQIMHPLREIGIPAAAIIDLDIIKKDCSASWGRLMKSTYFPQQLIDSLKLLKSSVADSFEKNNLNMKDGGINLLKGEEKESCSNLIKQLSEYGIFLVNIGELEGWMKSLEITGHGPGWLINMFEKLGESPIDNEYIKPVREDVWLFLGEIKKWINNPNRKGMPN